MKQIIILTVALVTLSAIADETKQATTIKLTEPYQSLFANTSVVYHVEIQTQSDYSGRLLWGFQVERAITARGESQVHLTAGSVSTFDIEIETPPVKPGVFPKGILSVSLRDGTSVSSTIEHPFYLFNHHAFFMHDEWLKKCNLYLYDPEETTAEMLDDLEIPYQLIGNPAAFPLLENATLLVGSGLSLNAYRGLPESLFQTVQNGIPVIMLAATEGQFPVPNGNKTPLPSTLTLNDREIIQTLNKKLDTTFWTPGTNNIKSRMVLGGQYDQAVIRIDNESGWPWLEMQYPDKTKLLLCGFAITEQWKNSPVPRYLLLRMLECVNPPHEEKEK